MIEARGLGKRYGATAAVDDLNFTIRPGMVTGFLDEVLGLVGLADVAGKRSKGFSLGMRQRLGIAAALLGDPQILIFDEPVNGLDPEGRSTADSAWTARPADLPSSRSSCRGTPDERGRRRA